MAVEPKVEAVGAGGGENVHPDHEGVLATGRREGVGEDQTSVSQAGQAQRILAAQVLDLLQRARASGGGREELQRRNGNLSGREGKTL